MSKEKPELGDIYTDKKHNKYVLVYIGEDFDYILIVNNGLIVHIDHYLLYKNLEYVGKSKVDFRYLFELKSDDEEDYSSTHEELVRIRKLLELKSII